MSAAAPRADSTPTAVTSARPRGWKLLLLALLGYAAIYGAFFPRIPGIADEIGFIMQARLWAAGSVSTEGAGITAATDIAQAPDGRHVSFRHPGMSLLLLPFAALSHGTAGMFVVGLVIQLAMTLVAADIFARWRLSPLWGLAVLFHPTLMLFSRTVMADGAAALMVLIAFWAVVALKRPHLLIGLAMGFATATRMQMAVVLMAFGVWALLRRDFKGVAMMVAGSLVFGLPLMAYNWSLFHNFTGFQFGPGFISPANIRGNVPFDLVCLTAIWPLMLPLALVNRRMPNWSLFLMAVTAYFAFLACYHHRDVGGSLAETLVIWPRLLQPIIPLLIVAYVHFLATRPALATRRWTGIGVAAVILGLAAQAAVFHKHQQHLQALAAASAEAYAKLDASADVMMNVGAMKLVGLIDEQHHGFRGTVLYFDEIDLLATMAPLNNPSFDSILWLSRDGGAVPASVNAALTANGFIPVPTASPGLLIWKRSPR